MKLYLTSQLIKKCIGHNTVPIDTDDTDSYDIGYEVYSYIENKLGDNMPEECDEDAFTEEEYIIDKIDTSDDEWYDYFRTIKLRENYTICPTSSGYAEAVVDLLHELYLAPREDANTIRDYLEAVGPNYSSVPSYNELLREAQSTDIVSRDNKYTYIRGAISARYGDTDEVSALIDDGLLDYDAAEKMLTDDGVIFKD